MTEPSPVETAERLRGEQRDYLAQMGHMRPRLLSLCSGYGGLDLAVEAVFGAVTVAHAEIEQAPSKVLAEHWPGVPNLGDLKTADWSSIGLIDGITAGYPCQPFSDAGQRKAEADERHIFPFIADAIRLLRPRFVVLENVRGHLVRGFTTVLGTLADLGFDAQWQLVRASDIGAPHRRTRLFVVAWPTTDSGRVRGEQGRVSTSGQAQGRGAFALLGERHRVSADSDHATHDRAPADADRDRRAGRSEAAPSGRTDRGGPRPTAAGHRADFATYAHGNALREQRVTESGGGGPSVSGFDRESAADTAQCGRQDKPDGSDACGQPQCAELGSGDRDSARRATAGIRDLGRTAGVLAWGPYEVAIERWERVLGRPAPAPTDLAPRGGQRLSPRFVEWMMGLPAGWVTDVPGISRNEQLKILGNGVVPQQAAAALRALLNASEAAA